MRRIVKLGLAAGAAVVVLTGGGYAVVAVGSADAPDKAALGDGPAGTGAGAPKTVEGSWQLAAGANDFVGYRIRERVAGVAAPNDVAGRTRDARGSLTVAGGRVTAAEITVNMQTLISRVGTRDRAMRQVALETGQFPTATFKLTAPVQIGRPERGQILNLTLPGDLTLHGVTRSVRVPVQARWNGATVQVAGSLPIRRADYSIDVRDLVGFRIDQAGSLEFELTFVPRGGSASAAAGSALGRDRGATGDPYTQQQAPPCTAASPAPPLGGGRLTFAAGGQENSGNLLYTVNADGAGVRKIPVPDYAADPVWTRDGRGITYTHSTPSYAPPDVRTVALRPGAPTSSITDAAQPSWSRDGRVAYATSGGSGSQVWVARADGSDARRVSPDHVFADSPTWSPAGRIAFTISNGATNDDIAVVNSDGNGFRRLTTDPGYEYAPAWSPDGRLLAYGKDGAIHLMRADGTPVRAVTNGTFDGEPAWAPDGRRLSFLRLGSPYVTTVEGAPPACLRTGQAVTSAGSWGPT